MENIKILEVPFVTAGNHTPADSHFHSMDNEPWPQFRHSGCSAGFSIVHSDAGITICFKVAEPTLKVRKRKLNGPVHRDNCVEFFVAFDNDKAYYNFEFNCLGSIKAGYGTQRENRTSLPDALLRSVQDEMEIRIDNNNDEKNINWELTVTLPPAIFNYHTKQVLRGIKCIANFTKCGDDLDHPHFLSWVNMESEQPNFHQPAFFGTLIFL